VGAALALVCIGAFGVDGAFIRGDAIGDGVVDVQDAAAIACYVFGRSDDTWYFAPPALDAADVNDDGVIDVRDVCALMEFLLRGGVWPCAPFPRRGLDMTPDGLHDSSSF
jgi:hypothetical protein